MKHQQYDDISKGLLGAQGSGPGEIRAYFSEPSAQSPEPKRILYRLIALAAGLFLVMAYPGTVHAQEMKIGYVDMLKVFDNYNRTKASDATLEQKGKSKQTELEQKMNELRKMRQNLELLNADARESQQRQIEERAEELQRFRSSTARDLGRERDKIAKGILEEIQQGISKFAQANGYAVILDSRSLLYAQPANDVTQQVLNMLNTRPEKKP